MSSPGIFGRSEWPTLFFHFLFVQRMCLPARIYRCGKGLDNNLAFPKIKSWLKTPCFSGCLSGNVDKLFVNNKIEGRPFVPRIISGWRRFNSVDVRKLFLLSVEEKRWNYPFWLWKVACRVFATDCINYSFTCCSQGLDGCAISLISPAKTVY